MPGLQQFLPVSLTILIDHEALQCANTVLNWEETCSAVLVFFGWVNDLGDSGVNEMVNLDICGKGK